MGMAAAGLGQLTRACDSIARAITFDGRRAEYHAHLARCLIPLKRDKEALAAVERALALDPEDSLTLDTIGVALSYLGRHQQAVEIYERATESAPENAGFQFNLATSLAFLGRFREAEAAYEAAIDAHPRFYKAHLALSELREQTPEHNHIERLEGLLEGLGHDIDGELHLRHALAKEHEDLGDYEQAFRHLIEGKVKKRKTLDYSIEQDRSLFKRIETLFDAAALTAPSHGYPTEEPLFVMGMPRTGTTLAERILASHPRVDGAGELQNFALCLKRLTGTRSPQVLDIETLEKGMRLDFTDLGHRYLESTRPATGHTSYFVDKLPLNFFYAGFIRLALPNAKMICLRRHPLDTCLSNFRQLFSISFRYYHYAYDLMDTAHYTLMFHALVKHWERMLAKHFLVVDYEDLVKDTEGTARRLLEFCDLEWDPQVLQFHRGDAPVATASAVQVRRPIYASSIDRWKRYRAQLQPVVELFAAHGITGE